MLSSGLANILFSQSGVCCQVDDVLGSAIGELLGSERFTDSTTQL